MKIKVDYAALPVEQLERMDAAGADILDCYRLLKKASANVVGQVLAHQGKFYELDHYPTGDVYDRETHSQYYYHAHRAESGEHGHFHTFLRAKGMPEGVEPIVYEGEGQTARRQGCAEPLDCHFDEPAGLSDRIVHNQQMGD